MYTELRIKERNDNLNGFNLVTSHPFFSDKKEVVFEYSEWGVSFRVPSIDDQKRSAIYQTGLKTFSLCIYNVDILHGTLIYDAEESTIDQIFFNYI